MKKRIIIKHFTQIWIVCFCLFFRPAYYVVGYTINNYGNYLTEGLLVILFFLTVFLKQYGYKMNKSVFFMWLLYFWCIIGASIINNIQGNKIDISDAIYSFSTITAFILLCDIGFWYAPRKTMFSFLFVGMIACAANAITMFLYSDSGSMNHLLTEQYGRILSQNYFLLGEDNATYFWSWPVLVIGWIYYYKFKPTRIMKMLALGYTILITCSYIYMWSVLAAAACLSVPFILFLLLRGLNKEKKGKAKNKPGIIRFWYLWIGGLLFDFLLSIQVILGFLQPIIKNVFQKDATLSYRTIIWERSYLAIASSPYWGFGNEPAEVSVMKIAINHTHNLILETLYRGGAIALILLITMFMSLTDDSRNGNRSVLYKFLEIMVFLFLIYSSMEFAFYRYHYLILLILMSHTEIIADSDKNYHDYRRVNERWKIKTKLKLQS